MGLKLKNRFAIATMSPDINNNAIIIVKGDYYCCIIYGFSKSDAI